MHHFTPQLERKCIKPLLVFRHTQNNFSYERDPHNIYQDNTCLNIFACTNSIFFNLEPNSYRHKGEADLSAEQIAAGFESLNALLRTSSWWNSSQVYGPDVNNIAKKSARRFLST